MPRRAASAALIEHEQRWASGLRSEVSQYRYRSVRAILALRELREVAMFLLQQGEHHR
jgi:hypothetical protein